MRMILLCLLLFSLLITAHARVDIIQEVDVDFTSAFKDSSQITTMDQDVLLNLPTSNIFDAVVAEAIQDFDRFASLSHEEIKQILDDFRAHRYS